MLKIVRMLLIFLTLLAAAGLVAVWAPDRSVEELAARWAPQPSQFVDIAFLKLHQNPSPCLCMNDVRAAPLVPVLSPVL